MNDRMACVAWAMTRGRFGLNPAERRVMLIGEYLILGAQVKGTGEIVYEIFAYRYARHARDAALGYTERCEEAGFNLTTLPVMQWSKKSTAETREWLKSLCHSDEERAALGGVFQRVIESGQELDRPA